jgi:CBS domain-containing protein
MAVAMKVEALMSAKVLTCSADATLDAPARAMREHDVGAIPVVDAARHVVGIVTDRDVALCAADEGKPLSALRVAQAMSRDVVTCAPGDDVADAARLMARHRVRRLVVVDGARHVAGILSLDDLACALSHGAEPGVPASAIAETLQGVCRHRLPVSG